VPDPNLAQFDGQKYISVESFKKNGEGVKTPVWFVLHNGVFYVYTEADSWKIKRIRNNPRVRVAVCNVRGTVKGPWLEATAALIEGGRAARCRQTARSEILSQDDREPDSRQAGSRDDQDYAGVMRRVTRTSDGGRAAPASRARCGR
jgi:PPOX class probable F420-dependent enzyme